MFSDKYLIAALLISLFFHTVIFLPLPYFKNITIHKKSPVIKIVYLAAQKISPEQIQEKPATKLTPALNKREVAREFKVSKDVESKKKPVEKKIEEILKPPSQYLKIEIPPEIPVEKEKFYLDYYQSIRAKVRGAVINNYTRYIACGEVCLYFVLLSSGELQEINILEKRSSQNRQLKNIAKKSLLEAAPFSAFPKDLDQAQLSFNVIISFELEK